MTDRALADHIATIPDEDKQDLLHFLHSEKGEWLRTYIRNLAVTFEYPSWQMTLFSSDDLTNAEAILTAQMKSAAKSRSHKQTLEVKVREVAARE